MPIRVWTKDEIKANIANNNNWLIRGLLAIFNNQTSDEQSAGTTTHDNGIGFNGVDAEILSSFATHYKLRGFLSPKQIQIARKKMLKYSGQLTDIANGKV